jgi:hypothetical protein
VGRVHRVGAVGGVPRGVRVPAASVLIIGNRHIRIRTNQYTLNSYHLGKFSIL